MRILLLSDNDYLTGLLKGYCINVGCEVKSIKNYNNLYKAINNKPPIFILIDIEQIPKILSMAEWQETKQIIDENHIILCCFGKQSFNKDDIQANLTFDKFFSAPYSEEEILLYLQEKLIKNNVFKIERRRVERRNGTDRRTPLTQMHATPPSDEQQYSEEAIRIGSLLINRSHRNISINDIPVDLSLKEFKIIDYLATNSDSVVKTEDIIKNVWEECSSATKADVHQYIHMLRKKIEVDPHNPQKLITVRGFGYELRP